VVVLEGSVTAFDARNNDFRTQTLMESQTEGLKPPSLTLETEDNCARILVGTGGAPLVLDASGITSIDSSQRSNGSLTIVIEGCWEIKITETSTVAMEEFLSALTAAHVCDGGSATSQKAAAAAGVGELQKLQEESAKYMATGLMQLIEPIVVESDTRVQSVMESQSVR